MNWLYKLRCFGYVEIEDDIWFPNLSFNALIKLKKSTGRIEIIDKFPNYRFDCGWLYSTVFYVDGYLVFLPNCSEEIVSYHIESRKFVSVPLDKKRIGDKKTYFVNAYVYKHYVYMFPTGAMCMVRYDTENHSVKYLDNCISDFIHTMPKTFYCFYQQFEVIGHKIYFPFFEWNAVAVFDVEDESANIKNLNIQGGCSTINYANGFFYLAAWNAPEIYRWNMETGEIKRFLISGENVAGTKNFLNTYRTGNLLIFFPEQGNAIISFNVETETAKKIQDIHNYDKEPIKTYFVQKSKEIHYILTSDMKCIHSLSPKDGYINMISCYCLDESYNKKLIDDFYMMQRCYNISLEEDNTLKKYIEILADIEKITARKEKVTSGEKVFKHIVNTIM